MSFKIISFKVADVPHKIPKEVIDYGVKMVGAPLEWSETQGEEIKVGIIDTGIDLNHEDLIGKVVDYYNFTSDNPKEINDENGHGTHVAGIVAANKNSVGVVGVAPKCKLFIAKAFDKEGNAETKNIVNSIKWLSSKGVNVINMSFSTQEFISDYNDLIKKCYHQGILCVCAAGNEGNGKDTIEYPARFPETVSVTAVDINKKVADFSSTGPRADVSAPGKDILSTWPNSTYRTLSGTSMATPLITGAVAILQAKAKTRFKRFLNCNEVKLILDMYTDDLGEKGKDNSYGYGIFSFGRLINNDYINSK
jgi:subtilisin family serine protease